MESCSDYRPIGGRSGSSTLRSLQTPRPRPVSSTPQNPGSQTPNPSPMDPSSLPPIFASLRSYCVRLLDLLRTPTSSPAFLSDMAALLRRATPDALQPCLEYTLFPLLLLLDAAVACRKGEERSGGETRRAHEVSDAAAEGALMCLEELLKKCHLGSVNQMVVVLKKLTSGAMLSPSEASEEFREGIIRCFRAMLLRLQPCSMVSCSCKQISLSVTMLRAEHSASFKYLSEPQECLIAFLQSEDSSGAVGHWLSLLLQTAENEAVRGLHGSASLRKEAYLTLRVLVAKVGTADALAFFLPGIVSRFTKALYVSKSMISGAAGNTGSIEHAVRGLVEYLMIVLDDGVNLSGLEMTTDDIAGSNQNKTKSTLSVLEALRNLPVNSQNQSEDISGKPYRRISPGTNLVEKNHNIPYGPRTFYVHRTKEWVVETSAHVDKLLSATFPHLSVHPAQKVRKGLVDGIRGILTNCCHTLKKSKLMLLECLCVLVFDYSESVSIVAQESLESLFMSGEKFLKESEVSEIFTSLLERLPRVVLGNDGVIAVSHAQRLLALLYYAGPELVVGHLLHSPVQATRFLEFLGLSFSHNSQYAGSVNNLMLSKPLSIGYLLSVAELKSGTHALNINYVADRASQSVIPKVSVVQEREIQNLSSDFELPRMPPWFIHVGNKKLYLALAGILRLSGISLMAGKRNDASLSLLVDPLLDYFRKLISELRTREYNKEGWQTWYSRSGSGLLLRQTSAAASMLNEIIYGLSDQSMDIFAETFRKTGGQIEACSVELSYDDNKAHKNKCVDAAWMVRQGKDTRDHIIYCIGSILHEYLAPEIWSLPKEQKSSMPEHDEEAVLSLHVLRDTSMLHQVIIDGIGIFNIVLGKDFVYNGFMHSSLYLLLQNLICSNSQIRIASDGVLRVVTTHSGHATVGHLVVANADYIVDSLCRELRHLDLNPHVADVLAAMLSYIGSAHDILPLLEEPMRAISLELEVLGRHQHPHLTIPFLKAVGEITKAARYEALRLPEEFKLFYAHINTVFLNLQSKSEGAHIETLVPQMGSVASDSELESANLTDVKIQLENLEESLFKLQEMKRYRRMVGSLVDSCLKAATPLLSSMKESSCLLACDIVEDVTISLEKVEEAYRHEKEAKLAIDKAVKLYSFGDDQDDMDEINEEPDENRLLPAMNKIWPFLVLCLKNRVSVAVIRRCTELVSMSVQISGGDFFSRRFHHDGPVIWKLLSIPAFRRKLITSKDEKQQILLPYRANPMSVNTEMAEVSSLKIQAAVLNMIGSISSNKKSAPALEAVLKKVSGLVVGIACSSTTSLQDASVKALSGLACIDPDLVWLLLADVYYSLKNKDMPSQPLPDLPELSRLIPPPSSLKEYMYVQYGGENFDVDASSVETVFQKMQSDVLDRL